MPCKSCYFSFPRSRFNFKFLSPFPAAHVPSVALINRPSFLQQPDIKVISFSLVCVGTFGDIVQWIHLSVEGQIGLCGTFGG